MKKIKKKAEFNFEWLFALIAGGMILMLAVYGAVRFSGVFKTQSDSELAKKIAIIVDPMQAGFAEGKSSIIEFNQETRINNRCENEEYGSNRISVSTKSGDKWGENGAETIVKNKYLFTSQVSGKKFVVFSKPFLLGFKISDLLFVTSEKFCLINPPKEIESEIESFRIDNFKLNKDNCEDSRIRVCFDKSSGSSNCNITIYGTCTSCENEYDLGFVEKAGQRFYYVGDLLYGAIVSDYSTYNCNVKRLFYRASTIAQIYKEKGELMSIRSCFSNLGPQLDLFSETMESASKLQRFDSSIYSIYLLAKELDNKNKLETCEVW
jgi:hypothetical protein